MRQIFAILNGTRWVVDGSFSIPILCDYVYVCVLRLIDEGAPIMGNYNNFHEFQELYYKYYHDLPIVRSVVMKFVHSQFLGQSLEISVI